MQLDVVHETYGVFLFPFVKFTFNQNQKWRHWRYKNQDA